MFKSSAHARFISNSQEDGIPFSGLSPASVARVRDGAYVLRSEWGALFSEAKIRTLAHASEQRMLIKHGAFSHTTAAAEHGLPLYRISPDRIHLIVPGDNARHSGTHVLRHHHVLPDDDIVTIDGLRVTSLSRTVYDVIRIESLEAAVVCFDAALRLIAWNDDDNTFDIEEAEKFRESVRRRIWKNSGARGIRQARFVLDFADGRAQLPGESIARLWMWQLGVPTPTLQYRVDSPDGTYALLDFAWPALGRWAEFDGQAKYTDPELLAGRSPEEVLEAQRYRQARIEQMTGWRCDRWGFDRMPTIDDFAKFLRSIGLR